MNLTLPSISLILSLLALVLAVFIWWQNRGFRRFKKNFFSGPSAGDLESVILQLHQRLEIAGQQQATLEQNLKQLQLQSYLMTQKVGLIRFNPFKDGGGNFSFCLALLDSYNNGIIITSMYGREQNRIYAKKIQDGRSDSPLNEEEQEAINIANAK